MTEFPAFKKIIDLDAPGAGNWQCAVMNAETKEWFIAHSRGRADGDEDVVLYRFDKTGRYKDHMTLLRCSHVYGFGVSDTNIIWITWNDRGGNDVVTLQYRPNTKINKSATQQMHVFSTNPVDISFSPSRDWAVLREVTSKEREVYRLYSKANILAGVDRQAGRPIVARRSASRVVQGFSVSDKNLYVLIGLDPKSRFRIEKHSFETGHKLGEQPIDPHLGLEKGQTPKVEPEGMDGRRFGMKVGTGDNRRLRVYQLTTF